jgi:hypothetical protein
MTTLEAIDVVAVNVGIVEQVAVTSGAAFKPVHRDTSLVVSTPSERLSALAPDRLSLTVLLTASRWQHSKTGRDTFGYIKVLIL